MLTVNLRQPALYYYQTSKLSSVSALICKLPSSANQIHRESDGLHISSGSSTAKASNAHWGQGVVCNPSTAILQPIYRIYPSKVVASTLLWYTLYSAYMNFISYLSFFAN